MTPGRKRFGLAHQEKLRIGFAIEELPARRERHPRAVIASHAIDCQCCRHEAEL
jgi:hypothetical protein